jgi:glycine cleavage system aminomethyltransferase T
MVIGDIAGLAEGEGHLSLVTNENGGIIDDTVITNASDFGTRYVFNVSFGLGPSSSLAEAAVATFLASLSR